MAKRKFALLDREGICTHDMGFPYTGDIPCTGPQRCPLCGSTREVFNSETAAMCRAMLLQQQGLTVDWQQSWRIIGKDRIRAQFDVIVE